MPSVPADCESEYDFTPNTHFYNGDEIPGCSDVDCCKKKCQQEFRCLAFDFNRLDRACYWFSDINLLRDDLIRESDVIDHYRVSSEDRCSSK